MKFFHNIYIAILVLILSISIFSYSLYHYCLTGTSNDNSLKTIEIKPGSIDSIATTLKEKNFIRNKLAFKVYIKLTGQTNLKAGIYSLSKDMGVIELVNTLEKGSNSSDLKITFKEGLNMRQIASLIEEKTNNTSDALYNILKDKEYLKSLIDEYWFLTDDILNDKIYYSLEGYLFPNTYFFSSEDVTIKTIIETMLDETKKQLEDYKDKIENNDYSIHELLTMASIVEKEGVLSSDRKIMADVLYKRLDRNWSLGCDVTTYYGLKINQGDKDANELDLNGCNDDYNTRCATFKGLPVSPICNPSIDAIKAAIEPKKTKYMYFQADKNGKIYFAKTNDEHNSIKAKLEREGLIGH